MKLNASWLRRPEIEMLYSAFDEARYPLRFVGGCVRDTVLGLRVREMDAATTATPEQMTAFLEAAKLRVIPTGLAHGTITVLVGGHSFEITTLRNDVTTDGRHAEVSFTDSWEDDARRRDFTMNALYLDRDGTLYDYVNGLGDCKERHVRFIGNAPQRISEDYLRILRYFRFVASIGNNLFDDAALAACNAHKDGIAKLSGERISAELLKLLALEKSYTVLEQMNRMGILPLVLSVKTVICEPVGKLDGCQADALVKLAALAGSTARIDSIAAHLKLSSRQRQSLEKWLSHCAAITPGMDALSQKKLVRRLGSEDYLYTLQLAYAFSNSLFEEYRPLAAMSEWQAPDFPVSAADLMARGFSEGKPLGDTLKMLENTWEESGYMLTKDALLTTLG